MTLALTVAYDANGNTLTDAQGRSYTWDFENRLVQAVVPGTGGGTTTFKYDPFGRRIYKQSPSFTSIFVYDGPNLIETLNASGTEVASYTQTQEIDETLAELRSSTTDYYEADGLGSITSLSTSAAVLANTYAYDSFGNITNSTGTLRNPFQYTGREFDSEANLYYYRARYYDPTVGRFLGEDSDESALADARGLYAYVENDPINYVDSYGLYIMKPQKPPNPPLPLPSPALDRLLKCIEAKTGLTLVVTSTSEPPPCSPHGPNDPHRRGAGLAVDIRYPSDPSAVLNAAACCGAKNGLDERKRKFANTTGDNMHLQLVPGPNPKNPGGDLPKNPRCKDCQQ